MADDFDLIVLGSGPSAGYASTRAAKAGRTVAVVDPRPVGGTCALHGCNPKKVLVRAAELVDRGHALAGNGTHLGDAKIDWADLIRFKRTFTDPVTPGAREKYAKLGITVVTGSPRFTGPATLDVGGRALAARKFFVGTGATPAPLPFPGADFLTTSDEFLELDSLPKRVTFVGGGYIAFEFAHVAARAGATVTVIDRGRPLDGFDADLVACLVDRSKAVGIDVRTETEVEGVTRTADGSFAVATAAGPVAADLVVHAAGRVPSVAGLDLDRAGVRHSERGIEVNDYFQSVSNDAVYAAGDVIASELPPLTPAAEYAGRIAARNLIEGNVARDERPAFPAAVFTVPGLAAVGLTEAAAKKQGVKYDLREGDWAKFGSVRKVGETHARYKVLIDPATDRVLGAHLLGPDAAEVINIFSLAIKLGATATDLRDAPYAFPTFVSDIPSMVS